MYTCECCDNHTKNKYNWKIHIETNKHISNLKIAKIKHKKLKICEKCDSVFMNMTNYNNHSKICKESIFKDKNNDSNVNEKNNIINDIDEEVNIDCKEMAKIKNDNIKFKEEINKFKEEINKYKKKTKTS